MTERGALRKRLIELDNRRMEIVSEANSLDEQAERLERDNSIDDDTKLAKLNALVERYRLICEEMERLKDEQDKIFARLGEIDIEENASNSKYHY